MHSVPDQEGGPSDLYRLQVRLLEYDIANSHNLQYKAESSSLCHCIPIQAKASKATKVAAQSEIHSLGNNQFLVLARDVGARHGQSLSLSVYRDADIFDISSSSETTDIESAVNDATNGSIASSTGVSMPGSKQQSTLGRFGLHDERAQDSTLLNEDWESLAIVPVDGNDGKDGECFLFSLSDNDFITLDGHLNFGKYAYKDASGYNLDSQALFLQIQVPKNASPF
ncbi:MAG: hypothetical protein Q9175_006844 [Cornicularia normoerica]